MTRLAVATRPYGVPAVEKIAGRRQGHPFQVLIGTLLSARTQDNTTAAACERLFKVAPTPRRMLGLSARQIEKLIYPVSFYRHKARHVRAACRLLLDRFNGRVPGAMEDLLRLPGVGRKTANLVLILSFGSQSNICVDTHVHRIANRLGWVTTSGPEETEMALYEAIEARWWPHLNLYLVTWGQNVCRPIGPRCGECVLADLCARVGVTSRAGAGSQAPRPRRASGRSRTLIEERRRGFPL